MASTCSGCIVGHELREFLFQHFVPGFESRDQPEYLLQNLPEGDAAVHGRCPAELFERIILLGTVENLLVDVVDDPVPLTGFDGPGDDVVLSYGILEFLEEHAVDLHPFRTDGLDLDRGQDVPAEIFVGARVGARAIPSRLVRERPCRQAIPTLRRS